jgi:hypothetical protein
MRAIRRKIRAETRLIAEPGFPEMRGPHYLLYLQKLHEILKPKVYFEIGTESGASLSFAECASIAVDPQFNLQADVSRNKPELHQYQGTSDDFFASGLIGRLGYRIDLAFLDGLHLFEFLLRDFINTERHMRPGGTIVLHDCVPINRLMAERDWDRSITAQWTGDVWKLIPILREYRPDLTLRVLDLPPTGLVLVSGLDPAKDVLEKNYQAILNKFMPLTIDSFGLGEFVRSVALERCEAIPEPGAEPVPATPARASRWERPQTPGPNRLRIAIKTPVPFEGKKRHWGDHHLARGLADGLLALGHEVRIDTVEDWHRDTDGTDFDLVMRGSAPYRPQPGVPYAEWLIYPGRGENDDLADLAGAAHVFVASRLDAPKMAKRLGAGKSSILLQGFDPKIMFPEGETARAGMAFVGSNHFSDIAERPIVGLAVRSGFDLGIWGLGWKRTPAKDFLRGDILDNAALGDTYRAAQIVLCDHMPKMRAAGYISNRIFDALACGTAVISDAVDGLPSEFEPFVSRCETLTEFKAVARKLLAEDARKRGERQDFARRMAARHGLPARAEKIAEVLGRLKLSRGKTAA